MYLMVEAAELFSPCLQAGQALTNAMSCHAHAELAAMQVQGHGMLKLQITSGLTPCQPDR